MSGSDIKVVGCCSTCDKEVFEIIERFPPDSVLAGKPRRLGPPNEDAMRLEFVLASGESMDLTFCKACAEGLSNEDYAELWQKVMRSWAAELGELRPDWFVKMGDSGILGEVGRRSWPEVMRSAH
jgi:hypothetical protein